MTITMTKHLGIRTLGTLAVATLVLGAATLLSGFKGCASAPPEEPSMCEAAADCAQLPHADCIGEWSCDGGQCVYACDAPEPTGCWSDGDCGQNQLCNLDVCNAAPGCGAGMDCIAACYGQCEDKKPNPETCSNDAQCPGGFCDFVDCVTPACGGSGDAPYACSDAEMACWGVCKAWTPQPETCQSDADCADGEFCQYELYATQTAEEYACDCDPSDEACGCGMAMPAPPQNGTCQEKQPPTPSCTSDSDCGPGMMCQIDACGGLVPACDCPEGDTDCGCATMPPVECAGTCVEKTKPGCSSDSDCGPNAYCQIEWCEDAPPAQAPACFCGDDEDCDCGGTSVGGGCYGVCMPQEPPKTECYEDSDCGPNAYCEIQWCDDTNAFAPCDCDPDDSECACSGMPAELCGGTCHDKQPPTYDCSADSDCGPNAYCQIEVCNDTMPAGRSDPAACYCPEGESECNCGAPVPPVPTCYGTCQKKDPPTPTCGNDSDCGPNAYCEIDYCESNGYVPCYCDEGDYDCECAPMPAPETCFGTCKPTTPPTCASVDCGPGFECQEICEGATCACAEGMDCDCEPDVACWAQCVATTEPAECLSDADCGAGQMCQTPPCLMWCEADDASCCGGGQCVDVPTGPTECVASGCSGEICAPQPIDSICIWQDWYDCLKLSSCQTQSNGTCGWSQNDAFDACMAKYAFGQTPANP